MNAITFVLAAITNYKRNELRGNFFDLVHSILAPDNATSMDQWYGDWLVASPLKSFCDAFEVNDKRRDLTVFVGQVDFDGNIHEPSNSVPTGYGLKKFLTPELILTDIQHKANRTRLCLGMQI